jgi:hypothetical protein
MPLGKLGRRANVDDGDLADGWRLRRVRRDCVRRNIVVSAGGQADRSQGNKCDDNVQTSFRRLHLLPPRPNTVAKNPDFFAPIFFAFADVAQRQRSA